MPLPIPPATVAHGVLDRLHAWGVRAVFAVPGAHVDPILTALADDPRFTLVIATHEQGAAYMADGHARFHRRPAAVITLGGPGATNLATAAMTARIDGSPVFFVTGDVPTTVAEAGGFQASGSSTTNALSVLREAVGKATRADDGEEVFLALDEAARSLFAPNPSPFHLCLPVDVSRRPALLRTPPPPPPPTPRDAPHPHPGALSHPLALLIGAELQAPASREALIQLCVRHRIPAASTLDAKEFQALLPPDLQLGVFGYAGGPRASAALLDPALRTLVVLGAPLDERNTGLWEPRLFAPNRRILHLSNRRDRRLATPGPVSWFHVSDPVATLIQWLDADSAAGDSTLRHPPSDPPHWLGVPTLTGADHGTRDHDGALSWSEILLILRECLPPEATLFVDSGEHRYQAGVGWEVGKGGRFLTAAQSAPMGWAIGAAIGAAFASDAEVNAPLWVLTGDGCLLMHGMELAVAARHQRRVVFLVSNNGAYGRVASRFRDHPPSLRAKVCDLPRVDWPAFAASLGVPALQATCARTLQHALAAASAAPGPFLIDLLTATAGSPPPESNCFSSATAGFLPPALLPPPQGR